MAVARRGRKAVGDRTRLPMSLEEADSSAGAGTAPAARPVPKAPVVPLLPAQRCRCAACERAGRALNLFVLDTNVLMHDPSSLFRFEEHDVFLPMMTLEELDDHKRGMSEVSRNARQVSRLLDALIGGGTERIEDGIALDKLGNSEAAGRLFLQTEVLSVDTAGGTADRQGRQPDPVGRQRAVAAPAIGRSCWCPRTSTCASRRMRSVWPQRITSTTRSPRTSTCSMPGRWRCRRISGTPTARTWSRGSKVATPSTA